MNKPKEFPLTLGPEELAQLARAKRLVEMVARTLNGKVTECACCQLKKAENWPEAQLQQSLMAVANRIENLSGWRTNTTPST